MYQWDFGRDLSNSIKTLGQLTMEPYRELCNEIDRTPQKMEDAAFLEKINQELEEKKSYLLVRRRHDGIYGYRL